MTRSSAASPRSPPGSFCRAGSSCCAARPRDGRCGRRRSSRRRRSCAGPAFTRCRCCSPAAPSSGWWRWAAAGHENTGHARPRGSRFHPADPRGGHARLGRGDRRAGVPDPAIEPAGAALPALPGILRAGLCHRVRRRSSQRDGERVRRRRCRAAVFRWRRRQRHSGQHLGLVRPHRRRPAAHRHRAVAGQRSRCGGKLQCRRRHRMPARGDGGSAPHGRANQPGIAVDLRRHADRARDDRYPGSRFPSGARTPGPDDRQGRARDRAACRQPHTRPRDDRARHRPHSRGGDRGARQQARPRHPFRARSATASPN